MPSFANPRSTFQPPLGNGHALSRQVGTTINVVVISRIRELARGFQVRCSSRGWNGKRGRIGKRPGAICGYVTGCSGGWIGEVHLTTLNSAPATANTNGVYGRRCSFFRRLRSRLARPMFSRRFLCCTLRCGTFSRYFSCRPLWCSVFSRRFIFCTLTLFSHRHFPFIDALRLH